MEGQELVYQTPKGTIATDTLCVATAFNKKHSAVLRAYDNLECDPEFRRNNFASATYEDAQGKKRRCVMMTRAGFTFLVMGFTGKKAAQFKQGYIEQFDRMEIKLKGLSTAPAPVPFANLTQREVQVQCVKQAASQLLRIRTGKNGLIQHHRSVMRCLTGKTPTEYVKAAVATGLRVGSFSGRELLRRLEPAKAATAAFLDDQLQRGKTIEQLTKSGLHEILPKAFEAMLAAGVTPHELNS